MIAPELKLALAKSARELADEIEAGKGPELGFGETFRDGKPYCAMGHVYGRAGLDEKAWLSLLNQGWPIDWIAEPVENANDARNPERPKPGQLLPEALRDYAFAVEGL